jgi:hypothetical protein
VALVRLSAAVADDAPRADLFASILALVDRSEALRAEPPERLARFADLHVLATAIAVARTPDVPVPELASGGAAST